MKEKGKGLLLIYLATLLFGLVAMVDIASATTPTIYVDPPTKIDNTLTPGKNFTISIKISNVVDMWAFEIKLSWGPTILGVYDNPATQGVVEGVTEGSFLKWGGSSPPQDTRLFASLNQTEGILSIMGTLLAGEAVSGNGTLVTIKFIVQGVGETALDLFDTVVMVIGPPPTYDPIPTEHASEDGFFSNNTLYDIAILTCVISKTVVCIEFPLYINITVQNQGNLTGTFNVTAYANTTIIEKVTDVILTKGNSETIPIIWNTTGFAKGKYTIIVTVSIGPSETDTSDNTCTSGVVTIAMVGDVKVDNKVNIKDIVYVAIVFGSRRGDDIYDPNADIIYDGVINIKDIVIVAIHFGETDP